MIMKLPILTLTQEQVDSLECISKHNISINPEDQSPLHWFLTLSNEQKRQVIISCPSTRDIKFDVRRKLCGLEDEQIKELFKYHNT